MSIENYIEKPDATTETPAHTTKLQEELLTLTPSEAAVTLDYVLTLKAERTLEP